MARRRLIWQFLPPFVLLALAALTVLAAIATVSFHRQHYRDTRADLKARAELIRAVLLPRLRPTDPAALNSFVRELGENSGLRITLVSEDGTVLADSLESLDALNNHADRPEIQQAQAEGFGYAFRYSHTLHEELVYAAIPVGDAHAPSAVIRIAVPAEKIRAPIHDLTMRVAVLALSIAVLIAALGGLFLRRITRPLEAIRSGAERFSRGDFSEKLAVPASREIGEVAAALNQMAAQLNERIELIVRQGNEQDAVLASMVEGVLAVDNERRIISVNQAAARLLQVVQSKCEGQILQSAVRNTALHQLVETALQSPVPVEQEILLHAPDEVILQGHATSMKDASGKRMGAVVVLNDITRLRRLERVRRDFVANVSHELRTPITAIKGFVETLLDERQSSAEDIRRFLEIIARQADRLNAIIDDLLMLSRLEQDSEADAEAIVRPGKLRPVIQGALQACAVAAGQRRIAVYSHVPDALEGLINPPLLEQSVINLLENAITYSEEGTSVEVIAESADNEVLIHVRDTGCGIASEHLPRIFERFYRVDKSRSRRAGGTGLGLAIVKHIAQAHGGSVRVTSKVGVGSTFTIVLMGSAAGAPKSGAP